MWTKWQRKAWARWPEAWCVNGMGVSQLSTRAAGARLGSMPMKKRRGGTSSTFSGFPAPAVATRTYIRFST